MDLKGIELADHVWFTIQPHLSEDAQTIVAAQLHSIFTGHGIDLAGTTLGNFVNGASIQVSIDL